MNLTHKTRITPLTVLFLGFLNAVAAPLTTTFNYHSTLTSDANGPLDLVAELNYDTAYSNAPIAVVMHGYSGSTGKTAEVRTSAQRIRDYGFFAISVAMRGRDGSDGVRDSGGLEIYDLYDAVEAVKATYPALVNPAIVYVTGYSGGGGNTLSALTKFPDTFNAGAAFFGMSDYGYDLTNGWYFYGADARTSQLDIDVGNPTPQASAAVTDRYQARASNLASVNNPYSEIHIFVNDDETICPPVNSLSYCSNAVSQEAYAGEFSNITVHIGNSSLYEDFNSNSVNDANEQQYWPHGTLTTDLQYAAEHWFMDRLVAGQIPKPLLNASDSLFVAGFVKTARFACFVGDGQEGAVRLDYSLTDTNLTFQTTLLSLNTALTSSLTVNTEAFTGRRLEVLLNSVSQETFTAGGEWTADGLADGDTLELRDVGPAVLWWTGENATFIGQTSAVANATLEGTNGNVWVYYGASNAGQQSEGWAFTNAVGSNVATGLVSSTLAGLLADNTYFYVFYATNTAQEADAWSAVGTFTTGAPPPPPEEPLRIDFNDNDNGPRAVQSGFTEIIGGGGIATNGYAVTGQLTITLTSGLDDRDRTALTGGPWLAQSDLLRDFIFRNTGTGLGITLSTLKAGEYTFTGYFHDCTVKQKDGTLGVDTGDGQGEVLMVPSFSYSTGFAPAVIGTTNFSFVADGIHNVIVYLRNTNSVQPYIINGFVLEKKVTPKIRDTLVAYYSFENSFTDLSGHNHHGTASGAGVTFVTDTPAAARHSSKAAAFNGTDYVTLPYLGLYDSLASTNGLSVSLWIKSASSSAQSWFLAEGYTLSDNPAYVFGHTTSADPELPTALVRTLSGSLPLSTKTTTAALYDGNWHHWVWTDFNGTANMYIDGVAVAAAAGTWNYPHNAIPFDTTTIGAWIRDAAETKKYPLVGQLDDVSIWNTVLSEAQITYLATGGNPMSIGLKGTLIRVN